MTLSIDLNDDEQRRLESAVVRTGKATEDLVHEAIALHLAEIEEIAWAEKAAEKWRASDKATRPFSEIRRELGL
ncbi:type II toxin-antitoxin system RelB family antitoxin [Herbiconiux liukaitaii]|uniref:type II toxin-antitoxin system RelB family antitoxin n=1 Tax=Herbiconiux liukaitaii TaxID=3342799 RepID=UPI0035B90710